MVEMLRASAINTANLRPEDDETLRVVDQIVPAILWEVRAQVETRAVMEAGNRIVLDHGMVAGAHAAPYNIIQSRLAMALATDLARTFDASESGRKADTQQKASIPILVHYLRKPEVREALERRAAGVTAWMANESREACTQALDRAIAAYDVLMADPTLSEAIKRIRDLRTYRLAHYLYHREPDRPMYADLFALIDFAAKFADDVTLPVMAGHRDMTGREEDVGRCALSFWRSALAGHQLDGTSSAVPMPVT